MVSGSSATSLPHMIHSYSPLFIQASSPGKSLRGAPQILMAGREFALQSANFHASKLSQYPPTIHDADMKTLENFVVMMYERSSIAEGVDDARKLPRTDQVVANLNVMEGANANALVLLAQYCVAADVKIKLCSIR
ncbi:hypothetical protein JOB18_032332 [Solea senegalensis]|uniref:Uncharacterized protein n=1 Tax=Solea senegalensis TaxID=28829 RepID=A0AAV6RGN5_SOLSE|nr:hypothetical protein JOB18_032332 [Solea senegalensis]